MPSNKKKGVRKVFPAVVVLATTFYYSSLFALGLLIGYLVTVLYCKKFGIDENSDKRIFLDFGNWHVHLHHWIMGILLIVVICLGGWRPEIPAVVWGMIMGMIIQDIYDYDDWHQVIIKKELK